MTIEEATIIVEEAERVNNLSQEEFEKEIMSGIYTEAMTSNGSFTEVPEVF